MVVEVISELVLVPEVGRVKLPKTVEEICALEVLGELVVDVNT